jgi:hypothetical protein
MAGRGPEWAAHSEARQGSDGEQLHSREGGVKRGKRAGGDAYHRVKFRQRAGVTEWQDGDALELGGKGDDAG